jgi:putative cell wall-binding protein
MRRLIGILVSVVALLVLVPAIHAQDLGVLRIEYLAADAFA